MVAIATSQTHQKSGEDVITPSMYHIHHHSHNNNNSSEDAIVQHMLNHLTDEEREIAARASYDYVRIMLRYDNKNYTMRNLPFFHKKKKPRKTNHDHNNDDDDDNNNNNKDDDVRIIRDRYALEMAKRYYDRYHHNIPKAIQCMKDTIQFRQKEQIDVIRNVPHNDTSRDCIPIRSFLSSKSIYITGYDKYGRSTYYFVPRNILSYDMTPTNKTKINSRSSKNHDKQLHDEYMKKGHLYSIERAIACSKANDRTINAVIDLNGFISSQHAPSYQLGTTLMTILNQHYSHYIHSIYFINAPLTFLYLWNIFKHFVMVNPKQKASIHFIRTNQPHRSQRQSMIDDDDANNVHVPRRKKKFWFRRRSQPQDSRSIPLQHNTNHKYDANHIMIHDDTNMRMDDGDHSNQDNNHNGDVIYQLYHHDQIPSWIIPTGTKHREIDIDEYLDRLPFDQAFDE